MELISFFKYTGEILEGTEHSKIAFDRTFVLQSPIFDDDDEAPDHNHPSTWNTPSDEEVLDTGEIQVANPKGNGNNVAGKLSKDSDIELLHRKDESNSKNEASNGKKERKEPSKRKREDEGDDKGGEADLELASIPKKREKNASQSKKKSADSTVDESSSATKNSGDGDGNDTPMFLNPKHWKQRRGSLNGTFDAARKNLTTFDDWTLPEDLVRKFTAEIEVCAYEEMCSHPNYEPQPSHAEQEAAAAAAPKFETPSHKATAEVTPPSSAVPDVAAVQQWQQTIANAASSMASGALTDCPNNHPASFVLDQSHPFSPNDQHDDDSHALQIERRPDDSITYHRNDVTTE